jgi:inorganic pyrophosphatase
VDFGPINEKIGVNGGRMPVDYGFLPGTFNEKEGDEINALALSAKKLNVGQVLAVEPIVLLLRDDGDDKIIAVDQALAGIKKWEDIDPVLREKIIKFFSFRHKISLIKGSVEAESYIERGR